MEFINGKQKSENTSYVDVHITQWWYDRIIPVMPVGGITTRASCPCLMNISRISIGFASAGKFFTKIVVFDRFFGAYELHRIYIYHRRIMKIFSFYFIRGRCVLYFIRSPD
jgi:hypothetical protein